MKMFTGVKTYVQTLNADDTYTTDNCKELVYFTGIYSEYWLDFIAVEYNTKCNEQKESYWEDLAAL